MTFLYSRLVILTVVFVFLIWSGWKLSHLMSRAPTLIKKVFGLLSIAFLAFMLWIVWQFQPWMPAGRAVHLSTEHIGDYDFQIWQRKNGWIMATEPFATGLFVRKEGGQWKAYLLDIQDTYRPSISLREDNSGVAILYDKTKRAYFDEDRDVFLRYHHDGGSTVFEGIVIDSEPPGNWWLQEADKK